MDGYQTFESHKSFTVMPMMLVCLNLPPELRFKEQNIMMHGIVPGPKQPDDTRSFLSPLIRDFERLQDGIRGVWNAFLQAHTTMRAHICLVGSDMIARKVMMGTYGPRGKSYCEYCNVTGVVKGVRGGIYCLWHAPVNAPAFVLNREMDFHRARLPYFQFGPQSDNTRHPFNLHLRRDARFREVAERIHATRNENLGRLFGISGMSIFSRMRSIVFPWSFPPDYMHLMLENTAKTINRHMRGVFFKLVHQQQQDQGENGAGVAADPNQRQHVDDDEPMDAEDPDEQNGAPRRQRRRNMRPANNARANFRGTNDPYNIPERVWVEIGKNQDHSRKNIPAEFGDRSNIQKHCGVMKAANWETWTLQESLLHLRLVLPEEHYNAYAKLVVAISIARKHTLSWDEADAVESLFFEFLSYYEEEVYRNDYYRCVFGYVMPATIKMMLRYQWGPC